MTINPKISLSERFAIRLRDTLIAAGYSSTRTPSGVDIFEFAKLIGHSPQICRKYLRGQAIPSSSKLEGIATTLRVSPGWLLFGDCHSHHILSETNKITINKELLHYIFSHMAALYHPNLSHHQLPDFFLELTQDISQIDADPEQSKKIVDLALSSAKQFNKDKQDPL
jgi:transcriptional regulator with XRE-family HTH domain